MAHTHTHMGVKARTVWTAGRQLGRQVEDLCAKSVRIRPAQWETKGRLRTKMLELERDPRDTSGRP